MKIYSGRISDNVCPLDKYAGTKMWVKVTVDAADPYFYRSRNTLNSLCCYIQIDSIRKNAYEVHYAYPSYFEPNGVYYGQFTEDDYYTFTGYVSRTMTTPVKPLEILTDEEVWEIPRAEEYDDPDDEDL